MPSILFVCTANQFRSPLAAAMFKKSLKERRMAGSWYIGSAGTWTTPGKPVIPSAVEAAQKFGLDLSGHRSSEVNRRLLSICDLVLVMQAGQKEALLTEFPDLGERIHLLSEVVEDRSYDIPDAQGSEGEVMEVVQELAGLIRSGLERICVLAAHLNGTRNKMELRDG